MLSRGPAGGRAGLRLPRVLGAYQARVKRNSARPGFGLVMRTTAVKLLASAGCWTDLDGAGAFGILQAYRQRPRGQGSLYAKIPVFPAQAAAGNNTDLDGAVPKRDVDGAVQLRRARRNWLVWRWADAAAAGGVLSAAPAGSTMAAVEEQRRMAAAIADNGFMADVGTWRERDARNYKSNRRALCGRSPRLRSPGPCAQWLGRGRQGGECHPRICR